MNSPTERPCKAEYTPSRNIGKKRLPRKLYHCSFCDYTDYDGEEMLEHTFLIHSRIKPRKVMV